MNNVINWQLLNEKSIYQQLKERLEKEKEIDKVEIDNATEGTDSEEEYCNLRDEYNLYYQKLEFISKLGELPDDKKRIAVEKIAKMDNLPNISDKQKIIMILSYGVLVDYFKRIHERSDEELFMLSACSSGLDLEDYTYYIGILSDESVSQSIISKSGEFSEQVDIAYEIMDSQDEFSYDFITPDNYEELVNNALYMVNKHTVGHTK